MPDSFSAPQSSLSFAKLVATPTETAWSQAYNAGNLFCCIGLITEHPSEELSLQATGKDIFSTLQTEFFTLEDKDSHSIKLVLQKSLEEIPAEVIVSLTMAYFKDNTLFVFTAGAGKIIMRRDEKIGTLLQQPLGEENTIHSASGFLKNGDTIILQSGAFAEGITKDALEQTLDLNLPTDIVEALSPQIHEQDNGAQAAIVITYRGTTTRNDPDPIPEPVETPTPQPEQLPEESELPEEHETIDDAPEPEFPKKSFTLPKIKINLPQIAFFSHLSHRRKLFLNIALILFLLLGISIFLTLHKKQTDEQKALFQQIYPQAKQDYETGQGLETLNPTLSQENYQKAEARLKDGETKFSKGSDEYKQLDALLSQVETSLHGASAGATTPTQNVEPVKHSLLQVAQTTKDGLAFGEDANNVYVITAKAISTVSKSSGDTKELIKNDNDWSDPKAVASYQGNIFVLDSKNGVLKFVEGSGGFGKTSYFKSAAPTQASGMAIDGSVWVALKSGTLMQYTKGVSDNLKLSGLTQPLTNPTTVVTDISMEHVYVLDQGNNRIVQFDKHGAFQKSYTNPVIGKASVFSVSEKNQTIQVLSGEKVYQMKL